VKPYTDEEIRKLSDIDFEIERQVGGTIYKCLDLLIEKSIKGLPLVCAPGV